MNLFIGSGMEKSEVLLTSGMAESKGSVVLPGIRVSQLMALLSNCVRLHSQEGSLRRVAKVTSDNPRRKTESLPQCPSTGLRLMLIPSACLV